MQLSFNASDETEPGYTITVRFTLSTGRALLFLIAELWPDIRYTAVHGDTPDVTPDVLGWLAREYGKDQGREITHELEDCIRTEGFARLQATRGESDSSRYEFVRWFQQKMIDCV